MGLSNDVRMQLVVSVMFLCVVLCYVVFYISYSLLRSLFGLPTDLMSSSTSSSSSSTSSSNGRFHNIVPDLVLFGGEREGIIGRIQGGFHAGRFFLLWCGGFSALPILFLFGVGTIVTPGFAKQMGVFRQCRDGL